jgi:hypothetical protein
MKYFLLLLTIPFCLFARRAVIQEPAEYDLPWLTGPLFAPSGTVLPGGTINVEPTFYMVAITGAYDRHGHVVESREVFWDNSFQPNVQIGLTQWLDFQFTPVVFYNYNNPAGNWAFGDFPVGVDVQIYKPPSPSSLVPYVKLALRELFPTGKYDRLNPIKRDTQIGGGGSYASSAGIVFGKLWHFGGVHFMTNRLLFDYTIFTAARVKGFNAYGGGFGTHAKVYIPPEFVIDFGMEVTLTLNWALACDFIGTWNGSYHHKGEVGTNEFGLPATLGKPAGNQFSIAPAIEYNWNADIGVIGGGWFTVAGKNAGRFWSAVFAINYYH